VPAIDMADGEVAEADMPVIAPAQHRRASPNRSAGYQAGGVLMFVVAGFMRFDLRVGLVAQCKHQDRRNGNRETGRHARFLLVSGARTLGSRILSDPSEPEESGSSGINLLRPINVAVEVIPLRR
jgi:hypothetical protein